MATSEKIQVSYADDFVTTIELNNGDYNYFDMEMLTSLADTVELLDEDDRCRVILLCSAGKAFCAGANFRGGPSPTGLEGKDGKGVGGHLYDQAVRLFATKKPVVAAVHGPAIGGGLGLAVAADFRVGCRETRMAANFTQLGIHPGFGLSFTLPRLVGQQHAYDMFYTGRRVSGEEAYKMGLLDVFVDREQLREVAHEKAAAIAGAAPLAVMSIRNTLRGDFAEEVRKATDHELSEQNRLLRTSDAKEGVLAVSERRPGKFTGS